MQKDTTRLPRECRVCLNNLYTRSIQLLTHDHSTRSCNSSKSALDSARVLMCSRTEQREDLRGAETAVMSAASPCRSTRDNCGGCANVSAARAGAMTARRGGVRPMRWTGVHAETAATQGNRAHAPADRRDSERVSKLSGIGRLPGCRIRRRLSSATKAM